MNQSKFYQEWFKKAEDDERSLKAILKEDGAPSTACFLAQQIAEKYLKGFLVFHQREFPKVHQLEKLLQLCKEIDPSFKELNEEAVLLSEFYIESRYPGDWPEFSWNDAKEAYNAAIRIKEFVLNSIRKSNRPAKLGEDSVG